MKILILLDICQCISSQFDNFFLKNLISDIYYQKRMKLDYNKHHTLYFISAPLGFR